MRRIIIALLLGTLLFSLLGTSLLAENPTENNLNINPSHVYVTLQPGECISIQKEVTVNPPNPGVNPIPPISGIFKVTPEIYPPPPPIDISFNPTSQKVEVDLEIGEWSYYIQ